ncbi:hypothetical protein E4K10_38805 [Streptomyces sp. T1317-0309]|nr:hypothetical protein E4K10_38805 [Streptomyces sp. T1317-0309]
MYRHSAPTSDEKAASSDIGPPHRTNRKSTDMGQILVTVATKIGVALAEAILMRLVWELWAAFSRRLHTATAPAAA